jgi:tRNA (cmo5U34)-methyltransferase
MNTGDNIKAENANWKFSGDTVKNFEEHIKRSVPYYEDGHKLIESVSDFFIKDDSTVYELGSSTGKLIYTLAKRHQHRKDAFFYGIEIEEDMIEHAKKSYQNSNLEFLHDDINFFDLKRSDFIISYYTVQFIHPKHRQLLIDKIYNSLEWGGAFVMFEKVRANDARFQDIITTLYMDYKLENGYSADEIVAKQRSLKGVLEPFSSNANVDMLKRAGFEDILTIFKYLNFEGILAIK